MVSHYNYHADGKLHTRFSELRNCTERGVIRIVKDRLNTDHEEQSNSFQYFGTARHEKFAEHLREFRKLPKKFELNLEINEDAIEHSYAIEVYENVVIHFTPDLHGHEWVLDFKTTGKGVEAYRNDKQALFYAWLLNKLGHQIKDGYYACEIWDKERTKILGYEVMHIKISDKDLANIEEWAKARINYLYDEIIRQGGNL